MFRRSRKRLTIPPLADCDANCMCVCRDKCPHPGCKNACVGGHSMSYSHWCPDEHWWKTDPVSPSRTNR